MWTIWSHLVNPKKSDTVTTNTEYTYTNNINMNKDKLGIS